MKNLMKKLDELDAKICNIIDKDPVRAVIITEKVILGATLLVCGSAMLWGGIYLGLKNKQDKDFQNGKFNPSIKEANVLSVNSWIPNVKLDINGNGKFDKGDFSFPSIHVNKDSKSVVYIDGVGKKKPFAYKRENDEYIIYDDISFYLNNSENLNKYFYDYMKDKKVFDLVNIEEEIRNHTK